MQKENCGFVPILDGDALIGVVTDRDMVIRGLAGEHADLAGEPVERVMTKNAFTIGPDASLEDAAHVMAEHEVRRLPVVEAGALVGILTYGNLEQALHARGRAAAEATLGVTQGA
jgi:CBS domain-containing protein